MAEKILLIETSQRAGLVALARGEVLLDERTLQEARRHARDLVPFCHELLSSQGWKANDLDAVVVSMGPGSYTGLRVGIMSAKMLAYATGCALVGVETFHALADQAPPEARRLDVLEDAQQGKVYVQRFERAPEGWQPASELSITLFDEWLNSHEADVWATGPGLEVKRDLPPSFAVVPRVHWKPRAESLLRLGCARLRNNQRDDVYRLEPLYLRPSGAEQQWKSDSLRGRA